MRFVCRVPADRTAARVSVSPSAMTASRNGMLTAVTRLAEVHPDWTCPPRGSDFSAGSTPSFCSLNEAAAWIATARVSSGDGAIHVCLHSGVHVLRKPLQLNESHAHTRWTTCGGNPAGSRAVISGGLEIPAAAWQPRTDGVWSAALPSTEEGGRLLHMRTIFANGVRANRTSANATRLLGALRCTADGYISEMAVPWDVHAEEVELNYFQQLAPWQAPRCLLTQATNHTLSVAQPCLRLLNERVASIPGLPRNRSSGRTGCDDDDPGCGHLDGNPLGSGLPLFVQNLPLLDPGLPAESIAAGQFSFSPRMQRVWFRPHADQVSADGKQLTARLIAPVAEGLVQAEGLHDVTFSQIDFEHAAWNGPSQPAGFVDAQDGFTTSGGAVPGAMDCTNCSNVTIRECAFRQMGGSGVTFGGHAQRISLAGLDVSDVSGNGIVVGTGQNASAPWQSTDNTVTDCEVDRVGQEFTGCSGIVAGYNVRLNISHNTLTSLPYGGINIGAGAARPGYAHDNVVSCNKIESWMLQMQDIAGIHVSGRQPGSIISQNFVLRQGLSGLEPPPTCDAPLSGRQCSLREVLTIENVWIEQIGKKYNISKCQWTADGWCNQTGNSHGGGIYMDNGSGGWDVSENVLSGVYNWMFAWDGRPGKMVDMAYHHNWVDSPLFSNNAAANNVSVEDNVLVASGEWPSGARAVMANAGARRAAV